MIYHVNLKYTNKQDHIDFIQKLNNQKLNILGIVTNSLKGDKYYEKLDIENNYIYKFIKSFLNFKKIVTINKFYEWLNK